MADLIVKSAVKEQLNGMNVAADFNDVLDEDVAELLEDAARRAEANDWKAVQPRDLSLPTSSRLLTFSCR